MERHGSGSIPPAFAPVEDNSFEQFGTLPPARDIPSGFILQEQGEFPSSLFLIRRGVVKMVHTAIDGSQTMLGLRSAGWIAGAAHALTKTVNTSTVQTVTNCTLSQFEIEDFIKRVGTQGQLANYLIGILAQELVTTKELVKQVMSSSAEIRLESYMQESHHPTPSWNTVDTSPLLKQLEIAQLLGITPEHLSRLQQKLKQRSMAIPNRS